MPQSKKSKPMSTTSIVFTGLATIFAMGSAYDWYAIAMCPDASNSPAAPNITTANISTSSHMDSTNIPALIEPLCQFSDTPLPALIGLTTLILAGSCAERAYHYHHSDVTICGKGDSCWLTAFMDTDTTDDQMLRYAALGAV